MMILKIDYFSLFALTSFLAYSSNYSGFLENIAFISVLFCYSYVGTIISNERAYLSLISFLLESKILKPEQPNKTLTSCET